MEVFCKRFPDLIKDILNIVDDRTLINFKETNKEISIFLNDQTFFAIRIFNGHKGNFLDFQESWNKVLENVSAETLKQFTKAVQDFFMRDKSRFTRQWAPFLIAAETGKLQLVKDVVEKTGEILQTGTYILTLRQKRYPTDSNFRGSILTFFLKILKK